MKWKEALEKALALRKERGKGKFVQSLEMALNFRNVSFDKPENRFSIDVYLPAGRGSKPNDVIVVAEGAMAQKLEDAHVVGVDEVLNKDRKALKKMFGKKRTVVLIEPRLMGKVARVLGPILGPRGNVPRPLVGDPAKAVERAKKLVRVAVRGKNMPVVHSFIGTEDQPIDDLAKNAAAVYNAVMSKNSNIKSVYVKTTMGPAVEVKR